MDLRSVIRRVITRTSLRWAAAPRIIVGAGGHGQRGWIATDATSLDLLHEADWRTVLAEGSVTAILAEHVWEHLEPSEALAAALRCRRYLRPGGRLRIAVPDGLHPDPAYREAVRPGGNGAGAADHRMLYTYRSLAGLLGAAGFTVHLLEYWDAEGVFHMAAWEAADGHIRRSARHDRRNADGMLRYTSLIVDGIA
jgi:predicted SAM-dependent methyltransferase